jgi:hypothetical protein
MNKRIPQNKRSIIARRKAVKVNPVARLKNRAENIFSQLAVRKKHVGSLNNLNKLEEIIANRVSAINLGFQMLEKPKVNKKKIYREIINSMNSLKTLSEYHKQGFKKTSFKEMYEKIFSLGRKNNVGIVSNIKSGLSSKYCEINSNFFDSALNKLIKLKPKLIEFAFSKERMVLTFSFDKSVKIPLDAKDFFIACNGTYLHEKIGKRTDLLVSIPVQKII